jgi:hypothetical protein
MNQLWYEAKLASFSISKWTHAPPEAQCAERQAAAIPQAFCLALQVQSFVFKMEVYTECQIATMTINSDSFLKIRK